MDDDNDLHPGFKLLPGGRPRVSANGTTVQQPVRRVIPDLSADLFSDSGEPNAYGHAYVNDFDQLNNLKPVDLNWR